MDEEQQEYLDSDVNRFSEEEVNRIKAMRDEDDMMLEIIAKLDDTEVVPDTGKYYTFIYTAKTPRVDDPFIEEARILTL